MAEAITVQQGIQAALERLRAGALDDAEGICRQLLEQAGPHPDIYNLLALADMQRGKRKEAVGRLRQAIGCAPDAAIYRVNLGILLAEEGDGAGAAAAYRRAIELNPQDGSVYGLLCQQLKKGNALGEAERVLREGLRVDGRNVMLHNELGMLLREAGRGDEALACFRRAVELQPGMVEAHNNIGLTLTEAGTPEALAEAVAALENALNLAPGHPGILFNLAVASEGAGETQKAMGLYEEALAKNPAYVEALNNLGNALIRTGACDAGIARLWEAAGLAPREPVVLGSLANGLKERGELDAAMEQLRAAVGCRAAPEGGGWMEDAGPIADAQSHLLYLMHFHPDFDARRILEEHRQWDRERAEPLRRAIEPHANARDPEKRLKVGYVSPDFREQAESFFVVPLLENHDHERFEIHGYSSVKRADAVTARHRAACDVWHEVRALSNEELAAKIRADGIDILVDLTMHMGGSRILLFARKPAPVQVAWLAYPGTTGLGTMDYRLTDRWMDPPPPTGSDESVYTERPIRLADSWCCYDPLGTLPDVGDLPAGRNGYVTFGSLNNFCKLNDGVLALWGRVLARVHDARLMLLAPVGESRQRVMTFFAGMGIGAERLIFRAGMTRAEYLQAYGGIDVGLDPFPYNGITTTCDALWMGVPVITRVGRRAAERAGLSLLSTAGLADFCATSDEAFVEKAVELATDMGSLKEIRAGLRGLVQGSPLGEGKRFAREVQKAYRSIWRAWCAS